MGWGPHESCDLFDVHANASMPGNVVGTAAVGAGSDAVDRCCTLCASRQDCLAWTVNWGEGTCYLQDSPCVYTHMCVVANGGNTVGISRNPPPRNCSGDCCSERGSFCSWLFDLTTDDSEHKPLNISDPAHAATAGALNGTLMQYWATHVPQAGPSDADQCRHPAVHLALRGQPQPHVCVSVLRARRPRRAPQFFCRPCRRVVSRS